MSESIQTLTLTDFLLARIAEDEASLKNATDYECWLGVDREYAECEAKRRIVDGAGLTMYRDLCLRALAAVYADHPDYREEWRP